MTSYNEYPRQITRETCIFPYEKIIFFTRLCRHRFTVSISGKGKGYDHHFVSKVEEEHFPEVFSEKPLIQFPVPPNYNKSDVATRFKKCSSTLS